MNLFKALSVALRANPGRRLILSETAGFPTDAHIAQGVVAQVGAGAQLLLVEGREEAIEKALEERGGEIAAVLLTHVHYTTSRRYDMARITAAIRHAGALMAWDLSHSAGVMPLDVNGCGVDFAVGCGYKHLNGGPGAPAFIFVAERLQHHAQPISGWMGHARPFDFSDTYEPAPGIARHLAGTPPVIAMAALEASVELILEAPMQEIRRKSIALGDAFIELMERHCAGLGFELASPRDGERRGSHVSYRHAASYPMMQALIRGGVVGDCRPPDLLRFGFAPLYNRYVDVWDAVAKIAQIARTRAWDRPEFHAHRPVT